MAKKIGIITLDGVYNYGNRLQNLAVQKIWEKEGFETETIIIKRSFLKEVYRYAKCFLNNPLKTLKFIKFNAKYINTKYVFNKKGKMCDKKISEFSFFSVGSDQVWNPNLRKSDKDIYYLKFAPREKRIALSPSIAVESVPDLLKKSFVDGISGFDYVSVRETQGADLIRELTGLDATVLVDPTLALTRSEWEQMLSLKERRGEDYILLYFLGEVDKEFMDKVQKFALENNLKIKSAHIKNGLGEKNNFDPRDFVSLIKGARYMFTDSFHGVAFSIIFNTSFYAFPRQNRENDVNTVAKSRLTSILEKTALLERFVTEFPENPQTIDFEKTNALIEAEREKVYVFVKDALERKNPTQKVSEPMEEQRGNIKAFACYNEDEKVRLESSSGGVYSLLANYVIGQGGVVAAAVYNENLEVEHVLCTSVEEIEKTRGAKYQPSHLGNIFKQIKETLDKGNLALFVGTPCQCGGLLSYLGKDYENLITTDFICHGVPSRLAWREYIKSLSERGFSLKEVNMRDKSSGWLGYKWRLVDTKGKVRFENHSDNPFMKAFSKNVCLRPSCYECRFKGFDRKTDITLGDYWGVNSCQKDMFDNKGTSLVFVNSEKGEKIFSQISEHMRVEPTEAEKAVSYNVCALESVKRPHARQAFFDSMKNGKDFIGTVNKLFKTPFSKKLKKSIKKILGR